MELKSPPNTGSATGIRTPARVRGESRGASNGSYLFSAKSAGLKSGFESPEAKSDLSGTPAAAHADKATGPSAAPSSVRRLGSWTLGDGTKIPAAIDHDYAQRELKHAQTPGVGRRGYKRGLANASQARKALDEYEARRYDADGVPEGRGDLITLTPRGVICADLYARYEAGEITSDELAAQWTAAWDADRAKAVS